MTQSQHQDSYVWTWEPAVGILIGSALLAILSLQAGRSVALFMAGAGWHWPDSSDLVAGTWSILRGDTLAGLEPDAAADPGALMWIIAALICGAVTAATVRAMCRHLAAARYRGMARAPEAAKLLGTARLRSHRAVIRPDLYPKGLR